MKNTKIMIIVIILLVAILGIMLKFAFSDSDNSNSGSSSSSDISTDTTTSTEEIVPVETSSEVSVEYTSEEENGVYTNYTAKIDLNNLSVDGNGANISDTTVKITSAGTYYFSGKSDDANIVVEADKNAEVVLVFDNAEITSTKTAVINGVQAKKITVNLANGSTNTFSDSSNYTEFTEDDEPDSTVFSKTDLVVNGSGKLIINANYKDAIASKDTLKIVNTNLEINANDDGIRGKDYIGIKNSNITVKSKGDAIKSTNTETNLGYIIIEGGNINIETESDGIQAESILKIADTEITIQTTGDTSSKDADGNSVSSKGLKAGTEITIDSGKINVSSTDDSIHSNKYIIINNGEMNLSSGDDGIHADNNILINNGAIKITKSSEGIESSYIEINSGNISVVASDDGINICGGNDNSGFETKGTGGFMDIDNGGMLTINGGEVYVIASGDGLDSNGSISITGGNITVAGAVNGGNGALDYNGKCTVTGGNLVVYGANGMWQNPTTDSTQYSIVFSSTGNKGDKIELKDSSGNTIAEFTVEMNYGMICISNSNLKQGETYTLYVNGSSIGNQELSSIVTSNGTSGNEGGMNGGMMKGNREMR